MDGVSPEIIADWRMAKRVVKKPGVARRTTQGDPAVPVAPVTVASAAEVATAAA